MLDVVHDPPTAHGADLAHYSLQIPVHDELGRRVPAAEECERRLKPSAYDDGARVLYIQVEEIPHGPLEDPMKERWWCRGIGYGPTSAATTTAATP